MVLRQEWLIDAGIPHFPISRNLTWAEVLQDFVRSFSAAVQRDSAGFVKNREEFFKKSLEFLRETDN